jgi:hypothetical protein
MAENAETSTPRSDAISRKAIRSSPVNWRLIMLFTHTIEPPVPMPKTTRQCRALNQKYDVTLVLGLEVASSQMSVSKNEPAAKARGMKRRESGIGERLLD